MESTELLIEIVEEYFGPLVKEIANFLLRYGPRSLSHVIRHSKLSPSKTREAVTVLIQHQLCTFEGVGSGVVYKCLPIRILNILMIPRCIFAAKTLYGQEAEILVEELCSRGPLSMMENINRAKERMEAADEKKLTDAFAGLVASQFLNRCPLLDPKADSESPTPTFLPNNDPFLLPSNQTLAPKADDANTGTTRKRRLENEANEEILWTLNFEKFTRHFLHELIVEMVQRLASERTSEVMRTFLRLNEMKTPIQATISNPITINELMRTVKSDGLNLSTQEVDRALNFIANMQERFLYRTGESSGGMYCLDLAKTTETLCRSILESIILEKYRSEGLRVFRLLIEKKFLEQHSIEKLAMLPVLSKDAKHLVYRLMADNIVSVKTLGKTMLRRQSEHKTNKALLERQDKVDTIVRTIECDEGLTEEMKAQQVSEVEETYLTVAEKGLLEIYRKRALAFHKAEIELEKTIFIFRNYLDYNRKES